MTTDTRYPVTWYRSTIFAAFMVAMTAFMLPGIFSALNGLGAGGGASADVTNAANAIVFGVLAVFTPFVGVLCQKLTPKWTLFIGTLGYAPYAAGMYVVDRYHHDWLLLFGSVTCGLAACFLWVSSGAAFIGYTEENRKGFAISLKFMLQNLGGSIGGIISLGLNAQRAYRGSVSQATYIVMITLMCLGFPFAIALPSAKRVQRTDGRPVILRRDLTFAHSFKVMWAIFRQPKVFALVPLWIYSQWFLSYQWQYNFAYFTVRTRALNSMLFYLCGLLSASLFGWWLDWSRFRRTTRGRIGFVIVVVLVGTAWILGLVVQVHYDRTKPTIDWVEFKYGLGCLVFIFWGMVDTITTTFVYWIAGSYTNNTNEAALLAALVNSIGSLGSTFGFVVNAMNFSLVGACAINLALFVLSVPSLSWVVFTQLTDTSIGTSMTGLVEPKESDLNKDSPPLTPPLDVEEKEPLDQGL